MTEKLPINRLLWGISILILIAAFIHLSSSNHTPNPLENLTQDEYRSLYAHCVINSTCNLYMGPGAVSICIRECMVYELTNSTEGARYHVPPLIIGSTSKLNINLTQKFKNE